IIYFIYRRKGILVLGAPFLQFKPIIKAFANGSSEMMTQLSLSIVNILYNYQLMRLVGEDGVSAYGTIMYVSFIFCSVFIGYSIGVAPIIGFNYGAQNKTELRSVLRKSLVIIGITSAVMLGSALALNSPLTKLFVGYDEELFELTRRGFFICSFIFGIMGFNIFGSAFFTALNNGLVSAIISFLRTLIFQVICVFALPAIFALDGVWASNVAAEILSIIVTVTFILTLGKRYGYLNSSKKTNA
ncbi:MAG: MATE family efflux transporter, partial [Clostridia bacterium]|nr:MATE family efflux transporter [Clostridia bacterium]